MRPLPRGEVAIHFGRILEHRHARQRFHDLEDFLNLRLHVNERRLAAALFQRFASAGKDPQAGTADEFQLLEIKDDVLDRAAERWPKLLLQFWRSGGIKAADELYGDGAGSLASDVLLDLDFEWHIVLVFRILALGEKTNHRWPLIQAAWSDEEYFYRAPAGS